MAYTLIATQTLLNPTATVTFTGIPQGFKDLMLECVSNNDVAGSGSQNMRVRFNGDTGTNYSGTRIYGTGTAASSERDSNTAFIYIGAVGNASAGPAITTINVLSYSNASVYKTALGRGGEAGSAINAGASLWRSTAAITSISLVWLAGESFKTNSVFKLWGVS